MNDSPVLRLLYQAALEQDASSLAIINADFHPLLQDVKAKASNLVLVQHFKPTINVLQRISVVSTHLEGLFPLILLLPSKDKQQSLAWMALAMAHLQEGGKLMLACENQYGAKSYESALKKLAGQVYSTSKAKCRLFSALKTTDLDSRLQQIWLQAAMPAKRLESHGLLVQPGLFSWKTADVGSLLLLESLPASLSGVGMDLCCGYGLLAHSILSNQQHIQHLHLVEADALALACAKVNTQGHEHVHYHHLDAELEQLPKKTDWLVCNPPFHRGQVRDVELGKAIVVRACHALKKGGEMYLVANRQLPYEYILRRHLSSVETLVERDGFKVFHGKR